jgi:cytochrome c-type biogenesis protein CcmH
VKPRRFAALAATLALLLLVAARIDGARRDETVLAPAAAYANDPALIPTLEAHLERTPRDGRGWVILARLNFAADRFDSAARAYERALFVSRKVAQDPQIWCEWADALAMAQGGSLKGRPRELIDQALGLKGNHPRALEMAGSAAYEAREYDRALLYWQNLLAQLDPRSREHRELQAAVTRLQRLAGMAMADSDGSWTGKQAEAAQSGQPTQAVQHGGK